LKLSTYENRLIAWACRLIGDLVHVADSEYLSDNNGWSMQKITYILIDQWHEHSHVYL